MTIVVEVKAEGRLLAPVPHLSAMHDHLPDGYRMSMASPNE